MSAPAPRRRGRRPAGEDTRGAIIAAARTVFAARGYEAATMRGIARAAGVDPRLVHHYFTGKEDVFVEAMQFPIRPGQVIGAAVEPGVEGLGERLVRVFLAAWDGPDQRERIVALLASAATSPEGARMLREFVVREILGRVVEHLPGPDPGLRAELAAAQLIGLGFIRYVVQVEPLASASQDRLIELLAPTLQRYLTGLPAPTPPAPAPWRAGGVSDG
jgi:AcrR family transcriptional regulator